MDQETLWRQYNELPADAQRQVQDFIDFLAARYPKKQPVNTQARPKLIDEPIIGMWSDRTDMADSTAWVRSLRTTEWNRSRD